MPRNEPPPDGLYRGIPDPEKVLSLLKNKFRKTSDDMELREYRGCANGGSYRCLWVRVEKHRFLDMVDTLMEIDFPISRSPPATILATPSS